jgi:tRNA dimethylallyltransferase
MMEMTSDDSSPLLVIAGPTASGKSALAVDVAERLGGVVINADSMQVYRDLEIVTARPPAADCARVPHRLYGVLDGNELCSAARWAELAQSAITQARAEGKVPILCGGTGLYLRTLLQGIAALPEIPDGARTAARALHREIGGAAFRDRLAQLDPEAAVRLHANDAQRLIRAYEVVTGTGRPLATWQAEEGRPAELPARRILLLPPRDVLYAAIDRRIERMVEAGALVEVRRLIERKLDPALPIMKAVGVPEFAAHLRGETTIEAAISAAQQSSRRYAKRQYTWFRNQFNSSETLFEQYSDQNAGQVCQKICIGA